MQRQNRSVMSELRAVSRAHQVGSIARRRRRRNVSGGRKLRLTVWHTDAGKPNRKGSFNNWIAARRLLHDTNQVYSTDPRGNKHSNLNVVFVPEGKREFSRDSSRLVNPSCFKVAIPAHFDNPLKRGLVFILDDMSQINTVDAFNNFDWKLYDSYKQLRLEKEKSEPTSCLNGDKQVQVYMESLKTSTPFKHIVGLSELISDYAVDTSEIIKPAAYFEMDCKNPDKQRFEIDFRREGKMLCVKMIDSAPRREVSSSMARKTIDVRHIAFYE